jgi:ABC-2 type transport system ATP-binding protein
MTVFVSSHVLAELEQFIDQVTIIVDGQIETSGPLDEIDTGAETQTYAVDSTDNETLESLLGDHEMVEQVSIRDDGDVVIVTDQPENFTAELQKLMADEGLTLRSLEEEGGLEETFLDLIEEGGA